MRQFGRQHGLEPLQAHLALLGGIAAPVDLVHARIDGSGDLLRAVLAQSALRQHGQVGNRQHRPVEGEGQTLDHANGNTHAGEGTGATPEGDGIQRGQGQTGFAEQLLDHRQQALSVQARRHFVVAEHLAVVQQGDRAGFGGGIQGQQSGHRGIRSGRQRAAL